ncbi:MAG TPA: hypothetical protein VGO92_15090 [Acidimicrobiales bacterium]|jgi:hypothetical protein|nr:hypothetical protein [Acidimicrobiales bacterium]
MEVDEAAMVDESGRHVWVVTWGRPGRRDWRAVLVFAFDADEARAVAFDAAPHLLPPDAAVLAAPATARAAIAGRPAANLPLIR